MRRASIGFSVHVYLNFEVFRSVMVAGWSNEVTKVLLTVCGVQKIQNHLDDFVRNKVAVAPETNYEWPGYVLHVHVCIACHTGHKAASMLGGSGNMHPRKFWKFRCSEGLSYSF